MGALRSFFIYYAKNKEFDPWRTARRRLCGPDLPAKFSFPQFHILCHSVPGIGVIVCSGAFLPGSYSRLIYRLFAL